MNASKKKLMVFVEGQIDLSFFEKAIVPHLKESFFIHLIPYANLSFPESSKLVKSIKRDCIEYLIVTDINSKKCITEKKKDILKRFRHSDPTRIHVVSKEIEAWYVAGLSTKACKEIGIAHLHNTDGLTKEAFLKMTPQKYYSDIVFKTEILKRFSVEIAARQNTSFGRFYNKFLLPSMKKS